MHELISSIRALRIVASPGAIDALDNDAPTLRLAPDEVLVITDAEAVGVDDPWAIIEVDTGFSALETDVATVERFLSSTADFGLREEVPGLTQGMAAGLAVKIWRSDDACLILVPTPFAHELRDRFPGGIAG